MSNRKNRRNAPRRAHSEATNKPHTSKDVNYLGVRINVSASIFTDIEFIDAAFQVEEEGATEAQRLAALMKASKMLAGTKWNELIKAIRKHNDGEASVKELVHFYKTVTQKFAPERDAS